MGQRDVGVEIIQEDGVWKMVHFHSSIGVPNEDAIGVELPT